MVKPAHNLMAYNSQICVDDKFKFIVATDVTSSGTDKQELHHMAMQTKEVITSPNLVILADKGYYSAYFTLFFHPFHSQPSTFLSRKQAYKIVA